MLIGDPSSLYSADARKDESSSELMTKNEVTKIANLTGASE